MHKWTEDFLLAHGMSLMCPSASCVATRMWRAVRMDTNWRAPTCKTCITLEGPSKAARYLGLQIDLAGSWQEQRARMQRSLQANEFKIRLHRLNLSTGVREYIAPKLDWRYSLSTCTMISCTIGHAVCS